MSDTPQDDPSRPAQFVGDSIQFLKDSAQDLFRLISDYRRAVEALGGVPGHEGQMLAIRRAEEEIDLPYLKANVPSSFERCFDGISRITSIVRAMKEFAHADQREKSPADLNRALLSTLTIAKNEYKYVAETESDLDEIPLVVCHLGDLNQVFLNLIVNAAHAISEVVGNSGARGRIKVTTRAEPGSVRIEFADTGVGIPEHLRDRIFEQAVANHHAPGRVPTSEFGILAATHVANALVHDILEPGPDGGASSVDAAFLDRLRLSEKLPAWQESARKQVASRTSAAT